MLHKFAARGEHSVGVTTVHIPDPAEPTRILPIDVWYPSESTASETAEHPFGQPHRAAAGAKPAKGPFPLVAFSHGNSGLRRQSTFVTTHLASRGFVVAAPDHVGNTMFDLLKVADEEARKEAHFDARRRRPRDMTTTIDTVTAGDERWPEVHSDRLGALGHSFGGWTSLKLPKRNARVTAVCGLAPVAEPFVGRKAFDPGELPLPAATSLLILAAMNDVLVDLEESVRPLYQRTASPRALLGVRGADHFHFCDGVELLHGMHVRNKRPQQRKFPAAYAQLLQQDRMHRIVCASVACFFQAALVDCLADPTAPFQPEAIGPLDEALVCLDRAA